MSSRIIRWLDAVFSVVPLFGTGPEVEVLPGSLNRIRTDLVGAQCRQKMGGRKGSQHGLAKTWI